MPANLYQQVVNLIDEVNNQDINMEVIDGQQLPKELVYGQRMTDMIERFASDADDIQKISVRGQHIKRWQLPRSDFPMDKKGYHLWRTRLYSFHAETTASLMMQVGYDEDSIERVKKAISKKSIKTNEDTQMLENIAALVFIEHYMLEFAQKHPEYDEDKWIDIIKKTWNKMSPSAQQFALSGGIQLPQPLIPLIQKAVAA